MAKDSREYGYEGEMVMSQLKGIMNHAEQLHDMLEPNTDLPEWVQSKITLAYDYMQTAADYMATEMSEAVDMAKKNQAKAMKAGANLKMDSDTGTPDHFTAAARRKKGLPEEVQINELSKNTVISYLNKNKKDVFNKILQVGKARKKEDSVEVKKISNKIVKRHNGEHLAKDKLRKLAKEEVAANSVGAGNVAGLQGEPPVNKKKKNVMSFNRFMKK